MKKILYITYRNFDPVSSGEKITMMQNLKILSSCYHVDCLILDSKTSISQEKKQIEKYAKNIFCIAYPNICTRIANCFKNLIIKEPLQNGYFYSKKAQVFVKKNASRYDLIFCTHMRTGQYLTNNQAIKKVLVCPDCITLNSKSEAKTSKGLRKLVFSIDAKNVQSFETTKYKIFDYLYVISQRDKKCLLSMDSSLSKKIGILFNSARDLGYSESVAQTQQKSTCFLGRVEYGPNASAILHFVDNIFPKLRLVYPDLIFNIYGGGSIKKIKRIKKIEGVVLHGYVDDVAKEIQRNTFVVAPMISGSGTQNKILECMMLKKLVITTKIGLDGLFNLKGDEIICADTEQEFIKQCLYYLSDECINAKTLIEEKAREYVLLNYSNSISEKQLLTPLKQLLD